MKLLSSEEYFQQIQSINRLFSLCDKLNLQMAREWWGKYDTLYNTDDYMRRLRYQINGKGKNEILIQQRLQLLDASCRITLAHVR